MSKVDARKNTNDDFINGKLLNEIRATSGTLYLDKFNSTLLAKNQHKSTKKVNVSMPILKSKHDGDDPSPKDKKSIWNWKPLKVLSHVLNRRFNCGFTLEVHTIEGLPSEFNGLSLTVHWKRRDGEVVTRPIKVVEGVALFEEKLIQTCSVYGSRNGPRHSAKYEAKHFLLYAAIHENPNLDLGKHRIDLTKILPLTLEELESEKSYGTWITSFKLLGDANGAVMNVSFGYVVLGDFVAPNNKNALKLLESKTAARNSMKSNPGDERSSIRRAGSFPMDQKSSMTSCSIDDANILRETPELSNSINELYPKFNDENSISRKDDKLEISAPADDVEPVKLASCYPSDLSTGISADEDHHAEFSVSSEGIKPAVKNLGIDQISTMFFDQQGAETPDNQGNFQEEPNFIRNKDVIHYLKCEQKEVFTKDSLLEHLESVLSHVKNLEKEALDTPEAESELSDQEYVLEVKPNETTEPNSEDVAVPVTILDKEELDTPEGKVESSERENEVEQKLMGRTESNLDHLVESVADEFLSMLGIGDSSFSLDCGEELESSRKHILIEYREEAGASGCSLFGLDIGEEVGGNYEEENIVDCNYNAPTISIWEDELYDGSDLFPLVEPPVAEPESPEIRAKVMSEYPKIRAKVIEDYETEELMHDWVLEGQDFESSPPNSDDDCRIPINLFSMEPPPLPALGEGLEPLIQTKTGGFLRALNPLVFGNVKGGGNLIMQVSSPVVLPAELGSGSMEILQNVASMGLELLSMQANKLMPLEEISGKTMQELAWESAHLEASKMQNPVCDVPEAIHASLLQKKRVKGDSFAGKQKQASPTFVSDEVEKKYVSLEDLTPLAMHKIEGLCIEGLGIQCGMEEEEAPSTIKTQSFGKFSALEGKGPFSSGHVGLDRAVGLQLLNLKDKDIDELMGLSLTLEEWMKLDRGEIDEAKQFSERTSKLLVAHHAICPYSNFPRKKCGLLGNNFTVALMIQLHDSSMNYEPVGMPMLALILVERVFLPQKPKIYCADEDGQPESTSWEETKVKLKEDITQNQDLISIYKINEVNVAGLETEPGKKKLWGSAAQQQAGYCWLLANGIGKVKKHPFMKSKVGSSKPDDTLWSISSQFLGDETNPCIRNPDIILPNETIKLR